MDLDVSKDSRGADTTAGPAINRKNVITQVLVDNGGTVVIGGIFELTELNDENKVPVLGDLPGVGNLFKNRSKTQVKKELLVFVTPRIITDNSGAR
jgi:type IV pilus assembly protein PilQ